MKKLFLIVAVLSLYGCYYPAYDVLYYTDFSRYNNDGFMVSSLSDYSGLNYTAIGDINIVSYDNGGLKKSTLDAQSILDKMVHQAKEKGANGVIGYKCSYIKSDRNDRPHWVASGVAVVINNNEQTSTEYEGENVYKKLDIDKAVNMASKGAKQLIKLYDNTELYFDPDSNKYISKSEFIKMYGNKAFESFVNISQLFGK